MGGFRNRKRGTTGSERGQALVETAFVLILLIILTFAIIDFASLFYVYLALENGVSQATRFGITGQQYLDPNPMAPPGSLLSRIESIKTAMKNNTPTLDLTNPSNPQYSFEKLVGTTWTAYGSGEDIKGGEIMRVTVQYHWNLITPLIRPFFPSGGIDIRVTSSVKNEGFS
jgi:Flp pilus assembly protein TadG